MNPIKTAALAVLALAVAAAAAADGPRWTKADTLKLDFKFNYVGFADRDNAVSVGYAGEIHYSADGGKTWPRAANSSACRFGLEVVDAGVAYHCGNQSMVGKSLDGGKTWTRVADFGGNAPRHAKFVSFCDAGRGWIATPTKLAATDDGGQSWQPLALPAGAGLILNVARVDAATGAFLDNKGQLWTSRDGGASWSAQTVVRESFANGADACPLACLRFPARDRIAIVFYRFGDQPGWVVRSSADAGATWSDETFDAPMGNPWLDRGARYLTVTDVVRKEATLFVRQ